jgi:hypothetical protein
MAQSAVTIYHRSTQNFQRHAAVSTHPAPNCLKVRIFITAGQRPAERIPVAYRRLRSPAFQAGGGGGYLPPQVVDLR